MTANNKTTSLIREGFAATFNYMNNGKTGEVGYLGFDDGRDTIADAPSDGYLYEHAVDPLGDFERITNGFYNEVIDFDSIRVVGYAEHRTITEIEIKNIELLKKEYLLKSAHDKLTNEEYRALIADYKTGESK